MKSQINWKIIVINHLYERDNRRCQLCTLPITSDDLIEVDHIIERKKGGLDEMRNLRVVHLSCHKMHHKPNQIRLFYTYDKNQASPLTSIRNRAEKDLIINILHKNKWNKSMTAKDLEISRPTLYDLMNKYRIKRHNKEEEKRKMHWLDKYIEEQKEQRELLDKITAPYTAAELQELITEEEELIMSNER